MNLWEIWEDNLLMGNIEIGDTKYIRNLFFNKIKVEERRKV